MKKLLMRISLLIFLTLTSLVVILLFPQISYGKSTQFEQITIYHNQSLSPEYESILAESLRLIQHTEIYDSDFAIDLCLDDGSFYPGIMRKIKGDAFGYGYANKVVIACEIDFEKNEAWKNGKNWGLSQLIAHEMLHCYQFNKFGFSTLQSPFWKLEGYPEYVLKKGPLIKGYERQLELEKEGLDDWDWVETLEGNGTSFAYFRDRLLIQYLIEVEGMTYQEILDDKRAKSQIENSLKEWSAKHQD